VVEVHGDQPGLAFLLHAARAHELHEDLRRAGDDVRVGDHVAGGVEDGAGAERALALLGDRPAVVEEPLVVAGHLHDLVRADRDDAEPRGLDGAHDGAAADVHVVGGGGTGRDRGDGEEEDGQDERGGAHGG
jgi:hypothetical protein